MGNGDKSDESRETTGTGRKGICSKEKLGKVANRFNESISKRVKEKPRILEVVAVKPEIRKQVNTMVECMRALHKTQASQSRATVKQQSSAHSSVAENCAHVNHPVEVLDLCKPRQIELQHVSKKVIGQASKTAKRSASPFVYLRKPETLNLSVELYEMQWLMLLLLRLSNNENIDNFYLGTNVVGTGTFGHLILKYNLVGHEKARIMFAQTKYRDAPDKVKATIGEVQMPDRVHNLHEYVNSYLRIKYKFNSHSADNVFRDEFEDVDCSFITYAPIEGTYREQAFLEHLCPHNENGIIDANKTIKTFKLAYNDDDIDLLAKTVSIVRIELLAERLVKFIFCSNADWTAMLSDKIIKTNHIILAQYLLTIDRTPRNYCTGKFRPTFFESNSSFVTIIRRFLCRKLAATPSKKLVFPPAKIREFISAISKNPSANIISKMLGSVLILDTDNNRLKCIKNQYLPGSTIKMLEEVLEKVEVTQETLEKAIQKFGEEQLKALSIKLPKSFGQVAFKISGTAAQREKKLNNLSSKLIELFKDERITKEYIVEINDSMVGPEKILKYEDVDSNGGIGCLVGNALIWDADTHLLKLNPNMNEAKPLFQKLNKKFLKDDDLKHKDLMSYRFDITINGIPRLAEFSKEYDKSLVKEFLSKLWFCRNHSEGNKLMTILKGELDERYITEAEEYILDYQIKTDAIFWKVLHEIRNWNQSIAAAYLTESNAFFDNAKSDVFQSSLVTILNSLYIERTRRTSITFNESSILTEELNSFISGFDKRILSIIVHQRLLSEIKLAQYFESNNCDNFCFVNFDYLEIAIPAFVESSLTTLIILCSKCVNAEDINNNTADLYRILTNVMRNNSSTKLIFVFQKYNILANMFKRNFSAQYIEVQDGKCNFTDLTLESQNRLLANSTITFQGKSVNLSSLVDENFTFLVAGRVVSKLIHGRKIVIGKSTIDLKCNDVKHFYVARRFSRVTVVKKSVEQSPEFFIVYSDKNIESAQMSNKDIVLITNKEGSFKTLCNKYFKHNIHWLRMDGNDYLWQQSHGDVKTLRTVMDTDNCVEVYEEKAMIKAMDKVSIITGEPGMGKSTVLTQLMLSNNNVLWTIRINILHYLDLFRRWQDNKIRVNKLEAIKFLYRAADFQAFDKEPDQTKETREEIISNILEIIGIDVCGVVLKNGSEKVNMKELAVLEIELFTYFYNQGKVVLLFDGLVGISPYYTDKVLELLRVLKNTRVKKIWIVTCADGILHQLEDMLSTFSYRLEPFTQQDHKSFLKGFWKRRLELDRLDDERFSVFADSLLQQFLQYVNQNKNRFFDTPLYTHMIAEVFQGAFKAFYESTSLELSDAHKEMFKENLKLVSLYKCFIEIKFQELQFEEQEHSMCDMSINKKTIEREREFKKDCEILSVCSLFDWNHQEVFLSKTELKSVTRVKKRMVKASRETSLIEVVDDEPYFVHRTFAEYFAAYYLWRKFKTININLEVFIDNIIIGFIENDEVHICTFFQSIAREDLKNYNTKRVAAIKYRINHLFTDLLNSTHLPDTLKFEDITPSTKMLLQLFNFKLSLESIIGSIGCLQNDKQLALLYVSAEMGYTRLARSVGENLKTRFLQSHLSKVLWPYSPLWLAALNNHQRVMGILVKNLSYNCCWKDKHNMTLLQYVLQTCKFDVLRSCLQLDIVDVTTTYEHSDGTDHSVLLDYLSHTAPSDVIELLIEKTDVNFINHFNFTQMPVITSIAKCLLSYDNNIMTLLKSRGVDLNASFPLGQTPFYQSTDKVCFDSSNALQCFVRNSPLLRDVLDKCEVFPELFESLKRSLEHGAIYSSVHRDKNRLLEYTSKLNFIHEILKTAYDGTVTQSSSKNSLRTLSDKALQLVIKKPSVMYSEYFQGYSISTDPDQKQIAFSPNYDESKLPSDFVKPLKAKIYFLPKYLQRLALQAFKENIVDDSLIMCTLDTLFVKVFQYGREIIDRLQYDNEPLSNIKTVVEEVTNHSDTVADLLVLVMQLYFGQDYQLGEAVIEVRREVFELRKRILFVVRHLSNTGQQFLEDRIYTTDEVLEHLNIKSREKIDCSLQEVDYYNNIHFVNNVLLELYSVGSKNREKVLSALIYFSALSRQCHRLMRTIDQLFYFISTDNKDNVNNLLETAREMGFIKAVLCARNNKYQTVLDFAYNNNNLQIVKLLDKYKKEHKKYEKIRDINRS